MSDSPESLPARPRNRRSISVIIPALDEEAQIAATLAALRSATSHHDAEIIAVDGGSRDRTREIVCGFDFAGLIEFGVANRGWQMNEGARASHGDALLFLHADVELPPDGLVAINRALADDRTLGGCFQIRFPPAAPVSLKVIAWGINLRTRWFRTATGDQAVFVRRSVFEAIGGYQNIPLMEDIALFNEIKRLGRVTILDERIVVSPRRWLKHGVWRTALLMYALRLGYWLGASPAKLKRFFVDVR